VDNKHLGSSAEQGTTLGKSKINNFCCKRSSSMRSGKSGPESQSQSDPKPSPVPLVPPWGRFRTRLSQKTQQGRRLAARKRGLAPGRCGTGSGGRGPAQHPQFPGRPCPVTVPPPTAPAAPPPPPLGGDISASAPGPPLTQVAAPQPGRVFQPQGPFPHVPQQVRAGATPRHGSARAGMEAETTAGGKKEGEGTRRSTPELHRHHPRAESHGRCELDGGVGGGAFSPEAGRHPDHSSPHTLFLRLPRTSRDQQQSPPSALLPPEEERRWRRRQP
jgi:hypothetical protein